MEASQKPIIPEGSSMLYSQPMQEPKSFLRPSVQHTGNNKNYVSEPLYCTIESSSSDAGGRNSCHNNSSSTTSFSSSGSPVSRPNNSQCCAADLYLSSDIPCGSPISGSCMTDNETEIGVMLEELQTAMLAPDLDNLDMGNNNVGLLGGQKNNSSAICYGNIEEMISRGDLKGLLCECAKAVENLDMEITEWLIVQLQRMVSVHGEPVQRLGAYMLEGLIARLASTGTNIYKALKCKEPTGPELLSYMHILYEACPYFKFGYESANGAIADAMKNEQFVHIIDFQISQGVQWISLIRALAARPSGPPSIRITGIDDPRSAFAREGGLEIVGQRLSKLAGLCNVPFEFHAIAVSGSEVQLESLGIRTGEAVAVNFPLVLHHLPDESVSTENHRDRLLRLAKLLSPKVVTLIEQEAHTNTAPFFPRFIETMNHYLAIYESIDVKLPREHKERVSVEQHCLAREIVNLVACEGIEREERHEPMGKWRSRFEMAGFKPYPLSSFVNATIKALLESYSDKYTLEEIDGVLYLGWMNQRIITSSAWR